jgi:hypothetical protein
MIERLAGAVNAAERPFTNRAAMRSQPSLTKPPASDAITKTARAMRSTRRRPKRSAARPPSRRKPP